METRRTRQTRAAPSSTAPEAARPARNSRQRRASEEPTASKRPSSKSEPTKGGSLTKNPVARRGTRPSMTGSIASSIPTNPDEDDDDEEAVRSSPDPEDASGDETAAVHMSSSDRQFLMFNIVNLAKAAEVVIKRMRDVAGSQPSDFELKMLNLKMSAFRNLRDLYELPGAPSPFLGSAWTKNDEEMSLEQQLSAQVALVLANLALALDFIKVTRESKGTSTHGLLEVLVTIFPRLFVAGDDDTHAEDEVLLALQLRTSCLIESLYTCKNKQEAYEATAAMFCAFNAEGDVSAKVHNGPFKKLARGENTTADNQSCSDRAVSLNSHIAKAKKDLGVASLRKAYPLEDTLASLEEWILATYSQLREDISQSQALWKSMHVRPDEFYDAADEPASRGSSEDDSSSEDEGPITRIQSNGESQLTLFRQKEDARRLLTSRATPSPSRNKRTHSQAFASSPATNQRNEQDNNDNEEEGEEEDGEFETDYRQPNPQQLEAAQQFKRQRIALASPRSSPTSHQHQRQPTPISHTQLAPPSSGPTAINSSQQPQETTSTAPTSTPSTAQDLRRVANLKKQVSVAHNAARRRMLEEASNPPRLVQQARQRVPWSDADSLALINAIHKCSGNWADIERLVPCPFEHPRNQQAYRDRARNMKVDYLITDCVLPECFDRVILGAKEIARVQSFNRNPYRMSDDVEPDGSIKNKMLNAELQGLE